MVKGFSNGRFYPKHPLTRAELATLVARLAQRAPQPALDLSHARFRDVEGSEWYFGAVLVAAGSGAMTGYADHTFRPNAPVTRNELAAALDRVSRLNAQLH